MFQMLTAVPIVLGICYTVYGIFELYAHRKERILLIEKLQSLDNIVLPDLNKLYQIPASRSNLSVFSALKIGFLLMGLGLGLVLALLMNTYSIYNAEIIYFAFMMLCGGLGLVIAWVVERKKTVARCQNA